MNAIAKIDRRSFIVAAGAGGLSLGFSVPFASEAEAAVTQPEINAWVVIKPDDSVVIRVVRPDMGQGSLTGLAQLVAEELECDWSKVSVEYPTAGENVARKRVWGAMNSSGSQAIRSSQDYVRRGGAAARLMLTQAAANEWQVPVAECKVDKGVVSHASGKQASYGELAKAAAEITPPDPKAIVLKDAKDWTIAGKPLKRLDTLGKVTGERVFGTDVKVPGMLLAAIRACPVNGGKVKSFDAARVEGMRGVKKVVQVGEDAVAVVADNFWNAKQAVLALPVEWDEGPNNKVSSATIAEFLKEGLTTDKTFIGNKAGDAAGALAADGVRKISATYNYSFQNHAPMEPMNATAVFTPDRCEAWVPTQNAEAALAGVIQASGLPAAKCEVYAVGVGGGFGRKGRADYVIQAVLIAKQMPGTPIKLIWTREEDMQHCSFHPITQCEMTASLDKDGVPTAWKMRISGQSIIASLAPERLENGMDPAVFMGLTPASPEGMFGYNIPNVLIDHAMRNTHLVAGFWRGVNSNHNAIYVESFIDELAHEAKQDPLEFRRKLLKPKQLAVLNAAAEKAGYGKPLPPGHFHGLSSMHTFGSYVAACAEVSVTDGKLKIHRISAATDPGNVVNPMLVERQVAGSFVYGLSALLYGEITVRNGAVEQTNFDTYNVMRIDEMPHVDVVVMPSGGWWGGVGEPTSSVAAPAVLNAVFAATGKRVRSFPLMKQDLRTS